MIIAHNLLAMNAQRQYNIVGTEKKKSTEKLSSGYRINRAADDAAGLSISEKMRNMIRGLNQGTENTQDGISWVHIADGAMTEIHDMLDRMMELSVQAANGTCSDSDRAALNQEYSQLVKEINMINYHTEFNTHRVFYGGSVQLAVSGDPNDLEVFDATYDSANKIVTYGGLKFHGERIRWDEIDPNMVSVVDGKQVFNKGVYKYTDSKINADYYFEVEAENTSELPNIKRNIELKADDYGIAIDGYKISWDEIGLEKTSKISGVFNVKYGKSTLELIIEEEQDFNEVVESINAKNDGKFEYQWITTCTGVKPEQAVDMYNDGGKNKTYYSEEIVDNNMAKNTKCNATTGTDPVSKLEYTIVIDSKHSDDPYKQTIYLEGSVGGKISGSEKTLASLGILSWDSGTSIRSDKEYTYKDTSGTGVEFKFKLSDITSFDSFEDGLYRVKLGGDYYTSYENKVVSNDSSVIVVGQSNFYDVNSFDQEIQLGRDFNQYSYEVQKDVFSYDANANKIEFTVKSVIPGKSDLYKASFSTVNAENEIETTIRPYVNNIYRMKLQRALANKSTDVTYDSSSLKTELEFGNSSTWVSYKYDRNEYVNALADALNVEMVKSNMTIQDVSNNDLNEYYVFNETSGRYVSALDYFKDNVEKALRIVCDQPSEVDGKIKVNALTLSCVNQWQNGTATLSNISVATGADIVSYVNEMRLGLRQNIFNSREELYEVLKNEFIKNGDYSNFRLSDNVDLYKVKVSYDGSQVSFGDSALNVSKEYILGYQDTSSWGTATPPSDIKTDINNTIDNYSKYVIKKISDASSYSINKDDKITKAVFKGNEKQNYAIRAYYDSEMTKSTIEKGIRIQHSNIRDDYTVIPQFSISSSVLRLNSIDICTEDTATQAINRLDYAIAYVSEKRSLLGAVQNRLEHTLNNNMNKSENLTASESRKRDTDMAKEMVNYTKLNILEQAITSVMTQANQTTQGALSLLQ